MKISNDQITYIAYTIREALEGIMEGADPSIEIPFCVSVIEVILDAEFTEDDYNTWEKLVAVIMKGVM